MSDDDTQFGNDLIEAMQEVAAWKRGEIALETREVDPMPAERIRGHPPVRGPVGQGFRAQISRPRPHPGRLGARAAQA